MAYEILGYGSSGTDQVLINRCWSKIAYVWRTEPLKNDDVEYYLAACKTLGIAKRATRANFWCCGQGQKVFSGPKGRPGRSPGHRGEAPARGRILDHFMPHLHQNASNLPRSLIPKRHESRFFFIRDTVHTGGRCPTSGFVGRRGI